MFVSRLLLFSFVSVLVLFFFFFFFQAEDGIRDLIVTGVQTCALPISPPARPWRPAVAPAECAGRPGRTPSSREPGPAHPPRATRRVRAAARAPAERAGGDRGHRAARGHDTAGRPRFAGPAP